ncbi:hypothetical protein K505DRAFT_110609 [Melanomma pulvis-pyrius CBS 109.77]|uniref:Prion-inhibition and propagation HeLo domain-containing protein n=1 Tax=Melanomma pulvis-pyrius CBS 109.77 TaxID=1314802 RepID=A0A6A6XPM1_9PLEO|nr:hypothetical protein K505DRAFT_110609 [Melanomma pulvis-pyrius CBS 109.77]
MEPVGLTIGAVALGSLFSLCIQCFDLIEIGQNTSVDYEISVLKLSIEKRRLMVWGEAVGILRPDQDRDPLLDDPETRKLVERILSAVQRLFDEAQNLRSKYGLERTSSAQNGPKTMVEGNAVCLLSFESSPLVQFQTRFSEHRKKVGLMEKTRWAIRDSKKFATLIQDLKDLLDGLGEITTSSRSTILKGQLIREETQSMSDLNMLKMIERTCSDADWRSSASSASAYFVNQNRLTDKKREDIQEWMAVDPRREIAQGLTTGQHYSQILSDTSGGVYGSSQLVVPLSSPPEMSSLRLKTFGKQPV